MNAIKFNKYHVTNGEIKAKVFYSLDNRIDNKKCVTLYANEWNRNLGKIFRDIYINETYSMTDYFDQGRVVLFEQHPLYKIARERAESFKNK